MATTNSTTNYELSQYVGSDVTSYLTNYNSDMTKIDAQMKRNADSAATANDNATIAVSTATTAASDASTALSTANSASSTAGAAQTAAEAAQTAAGAAQTDAAAALRASASNSIENLAPAYDPTLTYNVGDLVTYVDENNSGKLYKCIVAIAAPEAFNVNKWDDVTTSEAFAEKTSVIGSVIADGVKTAAELLNELYNIVSSQISIDSTYELRYVGSNFENHYLQRSLSNTLISFTCPVGADLSMFVIYTYVLSNASSVRIANIIGANAGTIADGSNDVIPSGTILKIVKI